MSALCPKCGTADASSITLVRADAPIVVGWLCAKCFDVALAGAAVLRQQFEELLAAGVPRDKANQIMISRIDGEAVS